MGDLDLLLAQVRETRTYKRTTEIFTQLVEQLLRDSLEQNASHIHLDCCSKQFTIRYRVRGDLRVRGTLLNDAAVETIKAVKVRCHLDVLECRRPQDGRTICAAADGERSVRVCITQATQGSSAVLTWEKNDRRCRALNDLGLLAEQEFQFRQMLDSRVGLIVVSGSAWSGRRTIGHAALMAAEMPARKLSRSSGR